MTPPWAAACSGWSPYIGRGIYLTVRQLLLAALGAAGLLLIDLPGLAGVSSTTSTFSGHIAANCSFNLPENISLNYVSINNTLDSYEHPFELTINNSTARIYVDRVLDVNEPPPYASSILALITIRDLHGNQTNAQKHSDGMTIFSTSNSSPNSLILRAFAYTSGKTGDKFELPSGNYSYRTTIFCLQ